MAFGLETLTEEQEDGKVYAFGGSVFDSESRGFGFGAKVDNEGNLVFENEVADLDDGMAAGGILNEFVKSYGFRRDPQTQEWSWSLENIGTAFQEDPFWTTLDYVTLAFPLAKWGVAAGRISKGAKLINAARAAAGTDDALRLTAQVDKLKKTKGYFAMRALADGELAGTKGAELARSLGVAGSTNRFGQFIDNLTGTAKVLKSKEGREAAGMLMDAGGASLFPQLRRGAGLDPKGRDMLFRFADGEEDYKTTVEILKREKDLGEMASKLFAKEATHLRHTRIGGFLGGNRISKEVEQNLFNYLESGGRLTDNAAFEALASRDKKAYQILQNTVGELHWNSFRLGRLSEGQFTAHLTDEGRQLWDLHRGAILDEAGKVVGDPSDFLQGVLEMGGIRYLPHVIEAHAEKVRGVRKTMRAAAMHLKKRKGSDPSSQLSLIMDRIAVIRSSQVAQDYFSKIAGSGVAETLETFAQKQGIESLDEAAEMLANSPWENLGSILRKSHGAQFPDEFLQRMDGVWIDPAAADSMKAAGKTFGFLPDLYHQMQFVFRTSKTVWNPATIVRNNLGNQVFQGFVTGKPLSVAVPGRGLRAIAEKGDDWKRMVDHFVLSGQYDAETNRILEEALKQPKRNGFGSLFGWYKDRTARQGRFYALQDEVYKAGAFLEAEEKYIKKLTKAAALDKPTREIRQLASEKAAHDIAKFFPQFTPMGPMAELAKQHIPFVSFTMEALRVYRNAMIEKPHMVLMYNHFFEGVSQTAAMFAGISTQEIEEANQMLPPYMDGKKTLLWPFRDEEGKISFVDMSYLMPLADLGAEAQDQQAAFLGITFPTSLSPGKQLTRNPLVAFGAAAATGRDPFTERPIEPGVLEGIAPQEVGKLRNAVGLAEYMGKTMLPPLVPPGYAGLNIWEYAVGRKSGFTGEELEDGLTRTVLANMAGFRAYKPEIKNIQARLYKDEERYQADLAIARNDYRDAWANDEVETMAAAKNRIVSIVDEQKGRGEGRKYFERNKESWEPGTLPRSLSERRLTDILSTARSGGLSPQEMRAFRKRLREIRRNRRR